MFFDYVICVIIIIVPLLHQNGNTTHGNTHYTRDKHKHDTRYKPIQ